MDKKNKVVVVILHRRHLILMHLRDSKAPVYPHHFALTSGEVQPNELPSIAARRELFEELRIKPKLRYTTKIVLSKESRTIYVYRAYCHKTLLKVHEGLGIVWVNSGRIPSVRSLRWKRNQFFPIARPYLIWGHLIAQVRMLTS